MRNSKWTSMPLVLIAMTSLLLGCGSSNTVSLDRDGSGTTIDKSVSINEQLFNLTNAFYCTFGAWPSSWEELQASGVLDDKGSDVFDTINGLEMKSPRAIVLVVAYRDAAGAVVKSAFFAPPTCGAEPSKSQGDHKMLMAGGRVSFGLSDAFRMLSSEEIKSRWKSPPLPDAAWINGDEIVLAIRFGELEVGREELSELLDTLGDAYEQAIPSLRWLQREINPHNGNLYLVHEFESDGAQDRIVTGVVSTSFDNKLVSVTVTGKKSLLLDVEALVSELLTGMRFN